MEEERTDWLSIGNDILDLSIMPDSEVVLNDHYTEQEQLEEDNDLDDSDLDDIGILQEDTLEYIAGYVIRKLNLVDMNAT